MQKKKKGDTALGIAAGANSFSHPTSMSHPSPPSICFFVSSFLCFFSFPPSPLPRSWSKESADTSAAARPPLSALFYFSWGGVGGVGMRPGMENKRDRGRDRECRETTLSFLPPFCLSSLTSTPCPLLSHRADLHPSPSFPFNSPFFRPSYLRLPFALEITHAHALAQRTHAQRWYRRRAVDGKITY